MLFKAPPPLIFMHVMTALSFMRHPQELHNLICTYYLFVFPSITVVEASSHCLRAILSTTSGSTVLNKLEQSAIDPWYSLLEPFRQNKKKVIIIHVYVFAKNVQSTVGKETNIVKDNFAQLKTLIIASHTHTMMQ